GMVQIDGVNHGGTIQIVLVEPDGTQKFAFGYQLARPLKASYHIGPVHGQIQCWHQGIRVTMPDEKELIDFVLSGNLIPDTVRNVPSFSRKVFYDGIGLSITTPRTGRRSSIGVSPFDRKQKT